MSDKKPTVAPKIIKELDLCLTHGKSILLQIVGGEYDDKHDLWHLLRGLRCRGHSINQLAQKAITDIGEV